MASDYFRQAGPWNRLHTLQRFVLCRTSSGSTVLSVSQEQQQIELAAMLLERASGYYHESGHGDTAGQVITKAAK